MTLYTITELVNLAKKGDHEARGELFLRYQKMVFSITYKRMHNYEDAQELVPDVFLRTFKKLDQLHEPRYFASWIRSIAVRMSINRWVRGARHRRTLTFDANIAENQRTGRNDLPGSFDEVVGDYDAPDERMLQQERTDCLLDAISQLHEMDRDALTEFYLHDRSINQMCEQFNAPDGTIKRRLHVARKRLAVQLEGSMLA